MSMRAVMMVAAIGLLATPVPALAKAPKYHPSWDAPAFSLDAAGLRDATRGLEGEAGTDAVVLFEDASYHFDAQRRVTYRLRRIYKVLTQEGADGWGALEVPWSPWYEDRPLIRVRVLTAAGVLHELDPAAISASGPPAAPNLYSDHQILRAPLPAMAPGAVVEMEITQVEREAFFGDDLAFRFYFGATVPVHQSRLIVDAPSSLAIARVARNLPGLREDRRSAGGRTRWSFTYGRQAAVEAAPAYLPGDVARFPYVAFSATPSWSSLAARYHERIEARIAEGGVEGLPFRASARDREGIVREALAFLHAHVRYTGLEFGESSIVPWAPAATWGRKYGDCKDQATLLVALLRRHTGTAQVALLRADDGEDVEPTLPSLRYFNHAIVYVPGSGSSKPIWIDTTNEYARAGELPRNDQGRLALIIAPETRKLVSTPGPAAADNHLTELREIHLAPFGAARVVEITEATGAFEQSYRASYRDAKPDKTREDLTSYMASEYMTRALTSYEFSDPGDLSAPFSLRLEGEGARRAQTLSDRALVYLYPRDLLQHLPGALWRAPEEGKPERAHDFVLPRPYVYELRYRIHLPPGFSAEHLPAGERRALGPAVLTSEFRREGDVVHATLRFDTVRARFTPAELRAVRDEGKALNEREPIELVFEHEAKALLAAGRAREAVEQMRALAAKHPRQAVYRSQLAEVFLQLGMGEAARIEARQAVKLDARSVHAQTVLAWVLQHDALGRRFGAGFDRSGSVAAYRKAKALDPKDSNVRGDLAILLEHDEQGERYIGEVKLDEAIAEYESRRKDLEAEDLDQNLLVALFYAGRMARVREIGMGMEPTPHRSGAMVAAAAVERGADEALAQARQLVADRNQRREALDVAVELLLGMRHYELARALATEAARGAANAAARQGHISMLSQLRRVDVAALIKDTPESVFQRLLAMLVMPGVQKQRPRDLFARRLRDGAPDGAFDDMAGVLRQEGWSQERMLDIVLSLSSWAVEAAPPWGWRVSATMMGNPVPGVPAIFVVREGNAYRILGVMPGGGEALGAEARDLAARGDLEGARKWLDWARGTGSVPGHEYDEAIGLPAFSVLWSASGPRDRERIDLAASSLMASGELADARAISALQRCAESRMPERLVCQADLARVHTAQKQWERALAAADRLARERPDAASVIRLRAAILTKAARWDQLDELGRTWLASHPDDVMGLHMRAQAASSRGDTAQARRWYEKLAALPAPDASAFNMLAWVSLFHGPLDDAALAAAQRAVRESGREDAAYLNTLALMHAARGEFHLAHQVLNETIEKRSGKKPSSSDWLIYGRMAQGYGLKDIARAAYARAERDTTGVSSHDLAARWLAELGK